MNDDEITELCIEVLNKVGFGGATPENISILKEAYLRVEASRQVASPVVEVFNPEVAPPVTE
ncbi:hypothetical protein M2323_004648 [Rhodoblastus acidophilus]|uniref:hypothetical protein n=1 Tax=Rhodoblastus acidophilus TaxID=1074 RepID=UPI0022251C29|nr:hypothetical protein [Rhodoblastus acidophilus]MCW2286652.1 hypothetical protein [Rhodoblastus acidophilus]MCW2335696.1 hypothetical protein [Rhodoblastus acidophilus]